MKFLPLLLAVAFAFCFTGTVKSQSFSRGTNVVSAGYGIGGYGWSIRAAYSGYSAFEGYKYSGFGPVVFSYERGITDKLGIGYIGVGGSVSYGSFGVTYYQDGFNSATSQIVPYEYGYRWGTLSITGRAAYHFDFSNDKLDVYTGAGVGFMSWSYRGTSTDPDFNADVYNNYASVPLAYQVFAGVRYYFTDNFGAYAEAGAGITLLNFGVNLKF